MFNAIVQFAEKNFTAKEISELSGDGLLVHSMWFSIQGEGPYAGYPAVFVRLAGCNRGAKTDACQFCDTNFLTSNATVKSVFEILQLANSYRKPSDNRLLVVITGGEPLLHSNLPSLVERLHHEGFLTQIETNGDFLRLGDLPTAKVVVSPKLSSHRGTYSTPPRGMLERANFLKFLVSADEDSPYHTLPSYAADFAAINGTNSVFISPINEYTRPVEPGEVASMWANLYEPVQCGLNHQYAAKVALDNHYRLSLQMHAYVAVP
jgi:7-carboxy-7-deazaguanine synthase